MHVSTSNPALIMFLIDRSGSMSDRDPETGLRLSELASQAVNQAIYDIALNVCMGHDGIRDRVHLSVYGYGDRRSPDLVQWSLEGLPDAGGWVGAEEWVPAYTDIEEQAVASDGARAITREVPVWVKPLAEGRTQMATAFRRAGKIVAAHMRKHPHSPPPIVINITDGHPGDVKTSNENWTGLQSAASEILGHIGPSGLPILLNVHLDPKSPDPIVFPPIEPQGTDRYARNMYRISSPLPDWMVRNARAAGHPLEPGSRGLIVNASPDLLSSFLSVGTTLRLTSALQPPPSP
jgi:hypothetical protein